MNGPQLVGLMLLSKDAEAWFGVQSLPCRFGPSSLIS